MSNFITQEFEPSSSAAWKQKIQFDLQGADYNQTLLTKTNEGITIKPFYHLDNFEKLIIPETKGNYKICQKITISSEEQANIEAINAINKGANALKFNVKNQFNYTVLFENLLHKDIEFHFEFNFLSESFITKLSEFLKNETIFLNIDIIGHLAKTGNWYKSYNDDFEKLAHLISKNNNNFILSVNTSIFQNAGANTVQQVAYALAHVNEYLTKFGGEIATKIQFNFAIGSHYFFEISKIRALKYLYNLILSRYNTNATAHIFAEPSFRNKTLYDPHVNMLRTTTECMSAILGGANTISNLSYDTLFHYPTKFGERISRNQLLILKEESYFQNAQHIATDSYYIESITKQLAEKALDIFKEIEASGGFLEHLKKGTIQKKTAENAKKEQLQFNSGELILIGTTKFPNESEKMKKELEINPFTRKKPHKTLITPVIAKRLSEDYEQKRLRNET